MSHGILDTDTMFSAREKPWHGLGTIVEGALTAEDALIEAGLNWEVDMVPMFTRVNDDDDIDSAGSAMQLVEDKLAIRRNTDNRVLGVASSRYKPVQPVEGFDFVDSLVDSGEAKYETAGSLWNGKKIWMLAKLPEGVTIAGEEIDPYILFTNSFTGNESIVAAVTPIRVVCQNTLSYGLGSAKRTHRIRHKGDVQGKLAEARDVLGITFTYYEEFEKAGELLAMESFNERMMDGILSELYPIEDGMSDRQVTNREDAQSAIRTVWKNSPNLENIRDTKWGAVNAIAEYLDWGTRARGERFERIIASNPMQQMKQKSFELVKAA